MVDQVAFDIYLALAGLALATVIAAVFFALGITGARPKLRSDGGGGGSVGLPGRDIVQSYITIRNTSTIWGLKARRETARIVSARLFDPSDREYVGPPLRWHDPSGVLKTETAIESGKGANLIVFGKERHAQEYFIYDAPAYNAPLAPHLTVFTELRKDFVLVLTDDLDREHRIEVTVRSEVQSVSVSAKLIWEMRLPMIKRGARMIWLGLTKRA